MPLDKSFWQAPNRSRAVKLYRRSERLISARQDQAKKARYRARRGTSSELNLRRAHQQHIAITNDRKFDQCPLYPLKRTSEVGPYHNNNQALSGSIDCSDFSCGWPMQAGRPFSRNPLWVIPQRTQALESKSKRCPRAVRSSGILALATQILGSKLINFSTVTIRS